MSTTVTIGTKLVELSPYRDSRSGPPPVYEVIGETRQSWVVAQHYGSGFGMETKVDKATMLERGKGERRSRFMTVAEYEHSKRRDAARRLVYGATSGYSWLNGLSDEKLDQLAALLELKDYEPLVNPPAPVASGPHGDVEFFYEDDGEVHRYEMAGVTLWAGARPSRAMRHGAPGASGCTRAATCTTAMAA